ncbi:MAG: EAL domain-containing protein, partial [Rubellimicrobium sp.]|nr:EAL domain-containing protein [Rubellimicrobium sp.]
PTPFGLWVLQLKLEPKLLGLSTALVMLQAVEVASGFLLDARVLLMGFAGLLSGLPGTLTALAIVLPARFLMGGDGAYIGALTLTIAPMIGLVWRQLERRLSLHQNLRLLCFGLLLSLSLMTIFLFPEPLRQKALSQAVPFLIALNLVGAFLAGWMNIGIGRIAILRERLRRRALRDDLTGLGNRLRLSEEIDDCLSKVSREGGSFALISLDFDNFKNVNDTLGHKTGDKLLKSIARNLARSTSRDEHVFRIAGDHFIILVPPDAAVDAVARARQILEIAQQPYKFDDYVLLLTASMGVVWAPDHGNEARLLLQNVEIAMYRSKSLGRNQVSHFADTMRSELQRQTDLTQALQQELISGEGFRLVYQPQFRAHDLEIAGAECLLRWEHAELGAIYPSEFIPIAEAAGLARLLDLKVVDLAAAKMAEWKDLEIPFRLSFNLSPLSLRTLNFATEVDEILARHEVLASQFEVELTESQSLEHSTEAFDNMNQMRSAGLTIALDDFGTGHSSLSYLERLSLDRLKVDRSFVKAIRNDKGKSDSILRAILVLAKALGLEVVAEGVETREQLEWLVEQNCDLLQGYYLGRPCDASEFLEILKEHAEKSTG